jgi:uncharacterized protein
MDGYITSIEELRRLYSQPSERAIRKQLAHLDRHCRRFVELSPFVLIATGDESSLDASPRGGSPGFVHVIDDKTLWIPDAPGNNRLDSLSNIVATGGVGLLFLIPGVDETLRVNGTARLSTDPQKLRRFSTEQRTPKLVMEIAVTEAYLQCAKALMRSRLWSNDFRIDRSLLPTLGEILADQLQLETLPESQQEMVARYRRDL